MFDQVDVVSTDDPPLVRDLMRFKPEALTPNAWAVRAGVSRTVWSDMRRHGNPSRRTLEKLLQAADSSLAEFEALRVGDAMPLEAGEAGQVGDASGMPWRGARLPLIPLFGSRMAGELTAGTGIALLAIDRSRVVGHVERPRSLAGDPDAYALVLAGDDMSPRFRAGKRIIVSPLAPLEMDDDVVAVLREGGGALALVKQMTGRDAGLVWLRQHNPDVSFSVEDGAIEALHKVLGEAI